MSDSFRISEVAALSGFAASTLRYYEQVGLLAAQRTPAGYRVYDEAALTRLRFIDRTKQLGLALEDIRELVGIWDAGQCTHVQDRLRAHVSVRSAQVQARIEELRLLGAQLGTAQVDLEGPAPEGPCADDCGCLAHEQGVDRVTRRVELTRASPSAGSASDGDAEAVEQVLAQPAVACTLATDAQSARLSEWQELLGLALERQPIPGGVRLLFAPDPGVAAHLAALAVSEQACCSFFTFTLQVASEVMTLDVLAPEDALPVVSEMFGLPA